MLSFAHLALRRGNQLLFEDASFRLHPGQKVGVTGANGCGKSSLFALVLGQIQVDAGDYAYPRNWVLAHVAQETPSDTRAVIEFVLDGDQELRQIEQELPLAEQRNDGKAIAELHSRYQSIGGYEARARAARLLRGLGFSSDDEHKPVDQFSGGWRMRLNLARALMCRSDLLLLDEPTNHLDLDAVIWLESWLKSYAGTLLLISHDREFLDTVVTQILHIEQQQVTLYPGNYSQFEQLRAERLAGQQAAYQQQQRVIAQMQQFVTRFRAKATKARQAQSRIKALERLERIAPAHIDSPFRFQFRPTDKLPHPLLRLDRVAVGYQQHAVLQQIRLILSPGDRIGLLGRNGAGKSTLIKLLAGVLSPLSGELEAAKDLAIGYFAQHQLEQLHPDWSPLEHLVALDAEAREQELRNYLGSFGFSGERAEQLVAPFSGGEKARLALALLIYQRPNLLLLDEPTNHLDLEMRYALNQALQSFEGALVVVAHDRHLLRSACDTLLLVDQGQVAEFPDDLDAYPQWLQQQADNLEQPSAANSDKSNCAAARKEQKRQDALRRQQLQPLRKELQQLERDLDRFTAEQQALEQQLADSALYAEAQKAQLTQLLKQKATVDRHLEETEMRWLEVSETLEAAR